MKLELHLLQNFAPSNLNRDDTGAPKDCELGGHRRARISSQCQKRAIREAFRLNGLLPEENLAARTKRMVAQVTAVLVETHGRAANVAESIVGAAIEGVGLGRDTKDTAVWKTEYLVFIPRRVIGSVAALLNESWDELSNLVETTSADDEPDGEDASTKKPKKAAKSKKGDKKAAQAAYPVEVRKRLEELLSSSRESVDLSLFGRMIADKAHWNVEASCQIAHAISTHKVQMDFDFYTAVDDFKPEDNAGSDMMGTIQFNSSCYYRYAVLDVSALARNLDIDDAEARAALVRKSVDAFVRAFMTAVPTGKQNTFAAHNFPSYALAIAREEGQPVSLANAFLKPARPHGEADLVDDSIGKLEAYLGRLKDAVGKASSTSWLDRDPPPAGAFGVQRAEGLDAFYADTVRFATDGRA
jgi:CRISPR system Cascade subunit CasC